MLFITIPTRAPGVSAVTKYFTPMDIQMIIISDKGGNDHSESEKKIQNSSHKNKDWIIKHLSNRNTIAKGNRTIK